MQHTEARTSERMPLMAEQERVLFPRWDRRGEREAEVPERATQRAAVRLGPKEATQGESETAAPGEAAAAAAAAAPPPPPPDPAHQDPLPERRLAR